MLFNTISEDIITNTNQFFDKQNQDRYREALPRIFDLALTIDNVENITNKELRETLQKKITRELQKGEVIANKASFFDLENLGIHKESLSLGIELKNTPNLEKFDFIKLFSEESPNEYSNFSKKVMQLYSTKIKIRRLNRLKCDYLLYKETLAKNLDSLLPIDLINNKDNIIKGSEFSSIINTLSNELKTIKKIVSEKQPLEIETSEHLSKLKSEERKLEIEIDNFPNEIKTLENFNDLIAFIGKNNAKSELFNGINNTETYNQELINKLQDQLETIDVLDVDNERFSVINLINEIGNKMKKIVKDSLENYGDWNFYFNYKEKTTQLTKPNSNLTENVGSSSNHMFLHLLHFLTLHYVILLRNSPYVPSFLLIDQLSRPYYGTDISLQNPNNNFNIEDHSDESKVYNAIKLLNTFISLANKKLNNEFQIILIEHIPKVYTESYNNFHVVENFDSENPLIPYNWYQ